MSRSARKSSTILSVVLFLFALPVAWKLWLSPTASAMGDSNPPPPPPLASTDVAVAMIRAGLDPEALAAAGLSAPQSGTIASNVVAAFAAAAQQLNAADAAFGVAKPAADALQRKIQSGLASQEEVASYQAAEQALTAAIAQRQAAVDAIFSAGTQALPASAVTRLQSIRNNRAWQLPIEFLVKDRAEVEWVAMRDALSNERITAKYGDPTDPQVVAQLASWRAVPDVALAKTNLTTNLYAITVAWNTAAN